MKIVTYNATGNPIDVLTVEERPARAPGQGEARVAILSAPIHNADLLKVQGQYGDAASLPATGGSEGVGRVLEVGEGVEHLSEGNLVFVAQGSTWAQEVTASAAYLIPVPEADHDQLAMLISSPASAHLMLTSFGDLREGDWVLQSAANSAVGSAVVQLARVRGLRTINVVRRPEVAEELRALGADAVLVGTQDLARRVQEVTGGAPVKLALDAVGGATFDALLDAVGKGATVVSYSQVVPESASVNASLLVFKGLTVTGFWLSEWFANASQEEVGALFGQLVPLVASGQLTTAVDSTYSLDELGDAVARAMDGKRNGKVLLHPNLA